MRHESVAKELREDEECLRSCKKKPKVGEMAMPQPSAQAGVL